MKLTETQTITAANHKGGCGKTTTIVNLAAACALKGYRSCIVDVDPQCNATDGLGLDRDQLLSEGKYSVLDAYLTKRPAKLIAFPLTDEQGNPRFDGNLHIVPGHRGLSQVLPRLEAERHAATAHEHASELDADDIKNEQRNRLRHSLQSLHDQFDFVFIDTPPDLSFLTTSALVAADSFILPVFPSGYDLKGLETLVYTAKKVRQRYNPSLYLLGVLLGRKDTRAKLDNQIWNLLHDTFGPELFQSSISSSVRQREAPLHGKTIFEHAESEKSAEDFLHLQEEFVSRVLAHLGRKAARRQTADAHAERMEANR